MQLTLFTIEPKEKEPKESPVHSNTNQCTHILKSGARKGQLCCKNKWSFYQTCFLHTVRDPVERDLSGYEFDEHEEEGLNFCSAFLTEGRYKGFRCGNTCYDTKFCAHHGKES